MSTPAPTGLTPNDIILANRAADNFTRLYYEAYDSATRTNDLPLFYRPSSSLTWNGNPTQGADGVKELIQAMPKTQHKVQSFDCHPIPGAQPPSLLVSVSGSVLHGKGFEGNPRGTRKDCLDGMSRVFSQTFLLVPDSAAAASGSSEAIKYYISADCVRFVG
ncbi:hypothetical protein BDV98DRAFT_560021 [Pterulicium gracile]|uniref:NTF2 domain-containing protein n=1 Tax=Pterulicium gracile TaxID=1884261 RepID=A0A5C3R1T8_9AGAR|nr:hypothetical protein BDV98DRAFT_560021 [Pterula gracilis]